MNTEIFGSSSSRSRSCEYGSGPSKPENNDRIMYVMTDRTGKVVNASWEKKQGSTGEIIDTKAARQDAIAKLNPVDRLVLGL